MESTDLGSNASLAIDQLCDLDLERVTVFSTLPGSLENQER